MVRTDVWWRVLKKFMRTPSRRSTKRDRSCKLPSLDAMDLNSETTASMVGRASGAS